MASRNLLRQRAAKTPDQQTQTQDPALELEVRKVTGRYLTLGTLALTIGTLRTPYLKYLPKDAAGRQLGQWSRDPRAVTSNDGRTSHEYLGPSFIILLSSTSNPHTCLYRREQDKNQIGQYINVK